ncbi:unnamed protein product [Urochloa decumbens]|uniref:Uncharacterized protein n=1 Tax=Urochloa decumbens TaxID=240449 RepID=A0ABC9A748_9POAL
MGARRWHRQTVCISNLPADGSDAAYLHIYKHPQRFHFHRRSQGLLPLFLRAIARLAACVATRPVAATAATVLYHAGALPRDPALERLVCEDMLDGDDCILHFVVGVMRSLG